MPANSDSPRVITTARLGTSVEMSSRIRRYSITMAFRMVCFVGVLFVHGWLRWALLAAAVFLPYVAVLFANQANQKGMSTTVEQGAPADAKQLTAGPEDEIVSGDVIADDHAGFTAGWQHGSDPPVDHDHQDRVA